ncbi:OmpA family protein [Saccharopolyspora aridisoli]|uniref:OmpA family protein n=1 Tax=Saccharopolyspora aridisoli TaxID=2530385 RepID=A0A4R4UWX7_9PSEU|nr:OmpA family protein [Saccharopolyspora aridisoli]TDC93744.1 OmpA family protein [Saccharopolyspora aridisoli]
MRRTNVNYAAAVIACTSALLAGCGGAPEGGQQPPGAPQPGQPQPGGEQQPPPGGEQPGGMGAGDQGGDQAKAQLQGMLDQLNQSTPITFDPDSSELTDQGKETVTKAADMLKSAPQGVMFQVAGFTASGTSSSQDSKELSQARAQAVVDQLAQDGVPAERLQATGEGDAGGDPAASRKVEIRVQ